MTTDTVPLREYFERVIDERQRQFDQLFGAHQDALQLAAQTLEGRLEKLNQLRQEVLQDRADYVTRDRHDIDLRVAAEKFDMAIAMSKQWQDRADGAIGLVRWLAASGALGLALEIARLAGAIK